MVPTVAALVSLPWEDYQHPSLSVGCLAAYARSKGCKVDAFHFHLDAASRFGFGRYEAVMDSPYSGEMLCAAILFPERRKRLLRAVAPSLTASASYATRIERTLRDIFRSVEWPRYRLVGFTINHDQLFSSLLLARWIKESYPTVGIVFGGRSISGKLGEAALMSFPWIDWCVDGEGEEAFLALIKACQQGATSREPEVPGLMYRCNGGVTCNPQRQLPNLDGLPDPDFDHYFRLLNTDPRFASREIQPYLPIEVSRGCSFNCAFCSERNFFKGLRHRPPREIAASLERMYKRHQVSSIFLIAQMVTKKHCRELFQEIAGQRADYRIFTEIRADLTREDLLTMKQAGVSQVQIGLEALDSRLLRKMQKGTRLIDNLKILKYCEEAGIRHISNLMLGFPTESQAEIDRSTEAIGYALAYRPFTFFSQFALREGTLVYASPARYGIDRIDDAAIIGRHLPQTTKKHLVLWSKEFSSKQGRRSYRQLRSACARWRQKYEEAEVEGKPLLYYLDCLDSLRIEDSRDGCQSILIEGFVRDLYLFCDSIRSFKEIRKRFPKVPEKELRKVLRRLFRLKVMYTEDDDWLSLAIHASPENRRHMPFL